MIEASFLVRLPPLLKLMRQFDFPHKLGICDRMFGSGIARAGIAWVETSVGPCWKLDLGNVTHRWIVYGHYEGFAFLNWAKAHLPINGVVVDSGANIGQMALYLAQYAREGRVLAVEPGQKAADWLSECAAENPGLPIEIIRCALGDVESQLYLQTLGMKDSHGSWNQVTSEGGEPIHVVRFEDLMRKKGISNVDLWKLDVEGYELEALRGAQSWLSAKRIGAVYAELGFGHGKKIVDLMASFGYGCFLFDSHGELVKPSSLPVHTNGLFLP